MAVTYDEVKNQRQQAQQGQDFVPNKVLKQYESAQVNQRTPQTGPTALDANNPINMYSRFAAEIGAISETPEQYGNNIVQAVGSGKIDPVLALEDPAVPEYHKNLIVNGIKEMQQAQQIQPGIGLSQ